MPPAFPAQPQRIVTASSVRVVGWLRDYAALMAPLKSHRVQVIWTPHR
jgi:hypothetical protein